MHLCSVMKKLRKCKHLLYVLKSANPNLRKAILKNAPKHVIDALSEICLNTVVGNVKISPKIKAKLSKYRKVLRDLSDKRTTLAKKRKLLVQKGGFLGIILSTLLSGLVGSLLNR